MSFSVYDKNQKLNNGITDEKLKWFGGPKVDKRVEIILLRSWFVCNIYLAAEIAVWVKPSRLYLTTLR